MSKILCELGYRYELSGDAITSEGLLRSAINKSESLMKLSSNYYNKQLYIDNIL